MPVNVGGYEITKEMGNRLTPDGSSSLKSAPSAVFLRNRYPNLPNGNYWIDFGNLGPQLVYCILDRAVGGGGWTGINSTISPQINNFDTSASWESNNSTRLMTSNPNILNVSVVERNCGDPSHYELKNPSLSGFIYTDTMLLMERVSTIGQCSAITDQADAGWYNGPSYSGSYTSSGMCTWGDGVFANVCCGAQNMAGLKPHWVLFGTGTNPNLRYQVQCAGGTGQHYHMWFVR